VKEFGKSPTDRQALDTFHRRSALSSRIIRHRDDASKFLDVLISLTDTPNSVAEETDGQPELASLFLPSQLGSSLVQSERSLRVRELERTLRRVTCMRALQRIRTTSMQKSQMIIAKGQNARGEVANTRAQSMISRLTKRVDISVWEYQSSRRAMITLGISKDDSKLLQPLTTADMARLPTILKGSCDLGEGSRQLPWFWSLRSRADDGTIIDNADEYNEGE
jgi:hypothetical protein